MKRWNPDHPLHLLFGLGLWSAWFVALYGCMSVVCRYAALAVGRGSDTLLNGLLLATAMALALVLLAAARRSWQAAREIPDSAGEGEARRFVALVGAALYLWAVAATAMVALPLLVVPACV